MKKINYSIYTLLFVIVSTLNASAASGVQMHNMSKAMFIYLGFAAVALSIVYFVWKKNEAKRKANVRNINQRRPMVSYNKRKAA